MQDDLGSILSQLSPEQLAQYLGLSTLEGEGSMLERQLAQAQALQQPIGQRHTTTLGSAFGAAGDVMRGIRGGLDERSLRAQQQGLVGKEKQGLSDFLATVKAVTKRQQREQAPYIEAPQLLSERTGSGEAGVPPWMLGMMMRR